MVLSLTSEAYSSAMPMSALARSSCTFSINVRKNSQFWNIVLSMSRLPGFWLMNDSKAWPTPYQLGIRARLWVHENTHGMARDPANPPARRLAGRELIDRLDSSSIGVACCQYSRNPGVSYTNLR